MTKRQAILALLSKKKVFFWSPDIYDDFVGVRGFTFNGAGNLDKIYASDGEEYFISSGEFLDQLEINKFEKSLSNKKPKGRDKYIGLELEFISFNSQYELYKKLEKADLLKYITISSDGSIRPEDDEDHDIELKILVKESEYKVVLKKLLKIIKSGSYVNDSCGLHVHLDMRHRNVKESYLKLFNDLDNLESKVDRSRLDSEYCGRNNYSDFDVQMNSEGRYRAINVQAYKKFKTLEVRLKEGSLDYKDITDWVDTLITTINKKEKEVA